jgi:hypothetical protein
MVPPGQVASLPLPRLTLARRLAHQIQESLEGTHRQLASMDKKVGDGYRELKEMIRSLAESYKSSQQQRQELQEEAETRLSWLSRIDYASQQVSLTIQREEEVSGFLRMRSSHLGLKQMVRSCSVMATWEPGKRSSHL